MDKVNLGNFFHHCALVVTALIFLFSHTLLAAETSNNRKTNQSTSQPAYQVTKNISRHNAMDSQKLVENHLKSVLEKTLACVVNIKILSAGVKYKIITECNGKEFTQTISQEDYEQLMQEASSEAHVYANRNSTNRIITEITEALSDKPGHK